MYPTSITITYKGIEHELPLASAPIVDCKYPREEDIWYRGLHDFNIMYCRVTRQWVCYCYNLNMKIRGETPQQVLYSLLEYRKWYYKKASIVSYERKSFV